MATATLAATPANLRDSFERDGFLLVKGLFSPEEVDEIKRTFMDVAKDGPVPGLSEIRTGVGGYDSADPLSYYPRMMHPHNHSELPVGPLSMRYMLDMRVHDVIAELFGEEPVAAQSMFYFKPPGARGQDVHQDNFYLRVAPGTCMAAWTAIDDADEENGGMVVVPGSHKLDIACPEKSNSKLFFTDHHVPIPEGLNEVPALMKAGDCLFFNGSLIHGSYPNTSKDRFRRSFICHYVPEASAELSAGYKSIRFDGTSASIPAAVGGGPCGNFQAMGPH